MTIMESNSSVPVNVKQIINKTGLKQKVVAERAGFSTAQFSAMLNGKKIIKVCDVLKIAMVLNVSPNDLFATH